MSSFDLHRAASYQSPALTIGLHRAQEEKTEAPARPVQKLPPPGVTAAQLREKPSSSASISKPVEEFLNSSLQLNSDKQQGRAGVSSPISLLTVGSEIKEVAKNVEKSIGQKAHVADVQVGVIISSCVRLFKREDPSLSPQAASKALQASLQQLDKELPELEKKYPSYPDGFIPAEAKEKIACLRSLKAQVTENPKHFEKILQDHGGSSLCKHLQPLKFLSMVAKSEDNCSQHSGEIALKATDENGKETLLRERIALLGYTTSDYKRMNVESRQAGNKPIKDSGIRAYVKDCDSAMRALPDVELPKNEKGDLVPLKRAIFPPISESWIKESFKEGGTYVDYGFASCSTKEQAVTGGAVIMTFEPPEGSTTMPHAKSLGEPYTIWPGEGEITFERGTKFEVVSVTPPTAECISMKVTLRVIP